ncbi:hypothetical protein ACFWTE_16920 [Nocardiopsis sp. NPDC058631]|uniref:hypothetical protein n=1 Tax=Nocardiopsis sp. NPDC058631 TaxID=3346566 RepID=UPI003651FC82
MTTSGTDATHLLSRADLALCREIAGTDARYALLSGSYARGWEHTHSDVDVVVGGPGPGNPDGTGAERRLRYVDGRRWEVEYYPPAFVDRLAASVERAVAAVERGAEPLSVIGSYELSRALRLHNGIALFGADRAEHHRARMRDAGLERVALQLAVDHCDEGLDDALGLLAAGDLHSSVQAAAAALGHAVDAFLADHGELIPGAKWRYRKYLALAGSLPAEELPLDPRSCWRWLTLADLDMSAPGPWVERAVAQCQSILFDIAEGNRKR